MLLRKPTCRGFPVWLKFVPGISFRMDNEPFKAPYLQMKTSTVFKVFGNVSSCLFLNLSLSRGTQKHTGQQGESFLWSSKWQCPEHPERAFLKPVCRLRPARQARAGRAKRRCPEHPHRAFLTAICN